MYISDISISISISRSTSISISTSTQAVTPEARVPSLPHQPGAGLDVRATPRESAAAPGRA